MNNTNGNTQADDYRKLNDLIHGIDIAMLTTVDQDGVTLRSRPMGTQKAEFDGSIWFFTYDDTAKVSQVAQERHVNVAYSDTGKQRYVSISGTGTIVRDRAKMEELWSPILKVWFPDGLDTPNLVLLKVTAHQAEYWESDGKIAQIIGFAKALVTGTEYDEGENEKVNLR